MTDKELKRLSRRELLQMLLLQTQENERLKLRLEEAETALRDRRIMLEEAGSIAEASLRLHEVFDAAQAAAQTYLENIRALDQRRLRHEQRAADADTEGEL